MTEIELVSIVVHRSIVVQVRLYVLVCDVPLYRDACSISLKTMQQYWLVFKLRRDDVGSPCHDRLIGDIQARQQSMSTGQ